MSISPTDLILVAVLKDKRDFEIARILGWYRIPMKTAPKTIGVDWLAFYQTAKFDDDKWAINFIAPVRGHELATRAELLRTQPDHPRANEQYYKVQLGPLERLPRSIPSLKWRRLTFLYTTGERLMNATEINDLIVQSDERELLWQALRERGLQAEKQYESKPGVELDLAMLCALGNLGVMIGNEKKTKEKRGWEYLAFSETEVQQHLPDVVQTITQRVKALGGVAASQK
jgi:hypothetical protein